MLSLPWSSACIMHICGMDKILLLSNSTYIFFETMFYCLLWSRCLLYLWVCGDFSSSHYNEINHVWEILIGYLLPSGYHVLIPRFPEGFTGLLDSVSYFLNFTTSLDRFTMSNAHGSTALSAHRLNNFLTRMMTKSHITRMVKIANFMFYVFHYN